VLAAAGAWLSRPALSSLATIAFILVVVRARMSAITRTSDSTIIFARSSVMHCVPGASRAVTSHHGERLVQPHDARASGRPV
jgi:hypothetical protein